MELMKQAVAMLMANVNHSCIWYVFSTVLMMLYAVCTIVFLFRRPRFP